MQTKPIQKPRLRKKSRLFLHSQMKYVLHFLFGDFAAIHLCTVMRNSKQTKAKEKIVRGLIIAKLHHHFVTPIPCPSPRSQCRARSYEAASSLYADQFRPLLLDFHHTFNPNTNLFKRTTRILLPFQKETLNLSW